MTPTSIIQQQLPPTIEANQHQAIEKLQNFQNNLQQQLPTGQVQSPPFTFEQKQPLVSSTPTSAANQHLPPYNYEQQSLVQQPAVAQPLPPSESVEKNYYCQQQQPLAPPSHGQSVPQFGNQHHQPPQQSLPLQASVENHSLQPSYINQNQPLLPPSSIGQQQQQQPPTTPYGLQSQEVLSPLAGQQQQPGLSPYGNPQQPQFGNQQQLPFNGQQQPPFGYAPPPSVSSVVGQYFFKFKINFIICFIILQSIS